ncbi:MAG: hypothetical protein JW760_12845 [Spirochaetales bacterium]|nr:hypothetical protein [Spirochaetales bacterium]
MTKLEEIESRIGELKSQLEQVEGTPTEVYSRIVGYYRPVKNWNKGKREEYGMRKVFSDLDFNPSKETNRQEEKKASHREEEVSTETIGYLYFYRPSCPNCPPVAEALEQTALPGRRIDVDTEEGFSLAEAYSVLTAPTVIFTNPEGHETLRASTAQAVRSAVGIAEKAEAGVL